MRDMERSHSKATLKYKIVPCGPGGKKSCQSGGRDFFFFPNFIFLN